MIQFVIVAIKGNTLKKALFLALGVQADIFQKKDQVIVLYALLEHMNLNINNVQYAKVEHFLRKVLTFVVHAKVDMFQKKEQVNVQYVQQELMNLIIKNV